MSLVVDRLPASQARAALPGREVARPFRRRDREQAGELADVHRRRRS